MNRSVADELAAVVADAQFGQGPGGDTGPVQAGCALHGEFVGKAGEFVVQVAHRVIDLAAEVFPVRVVAGHLGEPRAAQPGEVERESARRTAVGTAEVAVEKAVRLEKDHQDRLPPVPAAAEGAGGVKGVVFQLGLW